MIPTRKERARLLAEQGICLSKRERARIGAGWQAAVLTGSHRCLRYPKDSQLIIVTRDASGNLTTHPVNQERTTGSTGLER